MADRTAVTARRAHRSGPAQASIERRLAAAGARFQVNSEEAMIDTVANAIAKQQALGWFQGRMEFGPRALGTRSILGAIRGPPPCSAI